jgi:hypothetical protein
MLNVNTQRKILESWENATFFRADEVPCTQLGQELVFFSIENGKYYALKGTARRIWELLSVPTGLGGLIEKLSEEYGITAEHCAAETLPFLEKLVEARLAKASNVGAVGLPAENRLYS